MVERQIAARGVRSSRVLDAMRKVRREGYVPSYLGEWAYEDTPLPIEEEQTISQPYIVAFMVEALELESTDRVLEVGTGSGYAAAVLAEIAAEVFTIERHEVLARSAAERLRADGYDNVHVRHGDGTLGWRSEAPFDAIVVAAGGPEVPESLKRQLAIGAHMVIPVGDLATSQELERITRVGEDEFERETLGRVRFVPLVGDEGWRDEPQEAPEVLRWTSLAEHVAERAEPVSAIAEVDLEPLLERIGDARVVLLGEASHGTAEFYDMRSRITRALIEERGFDVVAVEADWPDAARIDHYVRDKEVAPAAWRAFARFPTWMWRNQETLRFAEWLRHHNMRQPEARRARFAGLDLYSLYNSIDAVLGHLDSHHPEVARTARQRYSCLYPWQSDPAAYGRAAITGSYRECSAEVVQVLRDLLDERMHDLASEEHFDATQNAALIANAEAYYRIMYLGSAESWNLRDQHMFDTLLRLLEHRGAESRAVVWAHNSHIGDARATEMAARGELNIGQLCRSEPDLETFHIGFGTDRGTVAAASVWGGPLQIKEVRPSHPRSYERVCAESGVPAFLLPLRGPDSDDLRQQLMESRLERAIGVIYRPETERQSHYFHAELPRQFDEYVWFRTTRAITPLETRESEGLPDTYPFGI